MAMKLSLKKIRMGAIALLLLVLGGGAGYFLGTRDVKITREQGKAQVQVINHLAPSDLSDVDFALFWEVWQELRRSYLEPEKLEAKKMVFGAIEGMTAAIGDPYTVFLPPKENKEAKEDLNGQFEGVGIQLGYVEETLAVMAPLEGMPAKAQGVRAGDLILRIVDEQKEVDRDTRGISLQEAVELIRGPKGTPVTLTLYRETKGEFEVTIRRDTIVVPSVEVDFGDWGSDKWEEAEGGKVVWLRVYRFGDNTALQWNEAVSKIVVRKDEIDGVVLDLRNNPGGLFQGAIDLASEFVSNGVVVKQQGRYTTETYSVTKVGRLIDVPLVVLINKGSASASEILAGALRDRVQAPLVGVNSFGKGTVQDAMDLKDRAGLHVTVARWLLPNGDWIHDAGLTPDVEVDIKEPENEGDEVVDDQLRVGIEELKKL